MGTFSMRFLPEIARRAFELLRLLPPHSEMRTYSLVCTRLRELICAKALDARGQGRELAATLGVQSWQVKKPPHVGTALPHGGACGCAA